MSRTWGDGSPRPPTGLDCQQRAQWANHAGWGVRWVLLRRHTEVLELLDWINPVFRDTGVPVDRFPTIYRQGRVVYRMQREGFVRTLQLP